MMSNFELYPEQFIQNVCPDPSLWLSNNSVFKDLIVLLWSAQFLKPGWYSKPLFIILKLFLCWFYLVPCMGCFEGSCESAPRTSHTDSENPFFTFLLSLIFPALSPLAGMLLLCSLNYEQKPASGPLQRSKAQHWGRGGLSFQYVGSNEPTTSLLSFVSRVLELPSLHTFRVPFCSLKLSNTLY